MTAAERSRKIQAVKRLIAGATTPGERAAAEQALERLQAAVERCERCEGTGCLNVPRNFNNLTHAWDPEKCGDCRGTGIKRESTVQFNFVRPPGYVPSRVEWTDDQVQAFKLALAEFDFLFGPRR